MSSYPDSAHHLARSGNEVGGLIIKSKKTTEVKASRSDSTFKKPTGSLLGLDILAKRKREQRETDQDASRTFTEKKARINRSADDDDSDVRISFGRSDGSKDRHYRSSHTDTPSHPGGVSDAALERFHQHVRKGSKSESGVYASSHTRGDRDKDRGRERRGDDRQSHSRHRREERSERRKRDERRVGEKSERSRSRDWETETPSYKSRSGDTPYLQTRGGTLSSWDVDSTPGRPGSDSKWDMPSPALTRDSGIGSKRSKDTPLPTPTHRYNEWADDRKSLGITPQQKKGDAKEEKAEFQSEQEREQWEEEQKRLDRVWYDFDGGYDETNNPFANIPEEYTKKKEEQMTKHVVKRISAHQRQINKDNEKWEENRLLTSGVVRKINVDEDFEEETGDKVHLLVHNIVPPFLDGRIVFTKQPEPVVPVKDPTSDMAVLSRKGSHLVRRFREEKERKKAQQKHWELAGTKMGNVLGMKVKEENDPEQGEDGSTNYKSGQQFSEHIKDSQAVSSFAKSKTIKQQREFLPIYASRQQASEVMDHYAVSKKSRCKE